MPPPAKRYVSPIHQSVTFYKNVSFVIDFNEFYKRMGYDYDKEDCEHIWNKLVKGSGVRRRIKCEMDNADEKAEWVDDDLTKAIDEAEKEFRDERELYLKQSALTETCKKCGKENSVSTLPHSMGECYKCGRIHMSVVR